MNFDYKSTIEKIASLEFKLNRVKMSAIEIQETISNIVYYREKCLVYLVQYYGQPTWKCEQFLKIDIFEYLYNHEMR